MPCKKMPIYINYNIIIILLMSHKSYDYKLSAVNYYLVEDKTQEEVYKIFKCSRRSLMRWVERYKKDGNVDIHYRKPVAYKVKKEYVDFLLQELKENIENVISKIPKEKYRNIFKCAYERPQKYIPKNETRKIKKNYL
jgi:hypothetical protein